MTVEVNKEELESAIEATVKKLIVERLDEVVPQMLDDTLNQILNSKKFYNIKEACTILNISFNTLKKYIDQGNVPCTRQGKKLYFTDVDFIAIAREGILPRITVETIQKNKLKLNDIPARK